MIYHLFYPLASMFPILNVTRYITFRGGCAFITSFSLVLLLGKIAFETLRKLNMLETIDMYGDKRLEPLYAGKKGTPTMGGLIILSAVLISAFLWSRWDNFLVWLCLMVMVGLGAVGLKDDLLKTRTGKGLSRREKLLWQILIGVIAGFLIIMSKAVATTWDFPFFKKVVIDLGYFYIFWAALVIVGTSNAVNFTDGLDGLAIGGVITNAVLFAILSYIVGNTKFSQYLFIPYIAQAGELSVLCFILAGAGLGFLWFNAHPAEIFMGDVGALALGGVLGIIALLIKKEFLLIISGGLFVLEAVSVIAQMISLRIFKKRVLKAAPFHHHLQLLGWKEPKIIVRLWIVSVICVVISLLTLKLR